MPFIPFIRLIGTVFSFFGWMLGIKALLKHLRNNRAKKTQVTNLLKLRAYLRAHRDERVVVKLKLNQSKIIVLGDAYDVTISNMPADGSRPPVYCLYLRQEILDGFYSYIERRDGLIFTLLKEEKSEEAEMLDDHHLMSEEPKETAFAFVLRLPEKDQLKEMLMRKGIFSLKPTWWRTLFSWPTTWPPFR